MELVEESRGSGRRFGLYELRERQPDWNLAAIQSPKLEIEQGGETDPEPVGPHEPGGGGVDAAEFLDACGDGDPEQEDVGQGQGRVAPGEKAERPEAVEHQLQCEESEAMGVVSDSAAGDSHENVEHGPDRCKQPVGGVEPGFFEGRIPVPQMALGGPAARQSNQLADAQVEKETHVFSLHSGPCNCK